MTSLLCPISDAFLSNIIQSTYNWFLYKIWDSQNFATDQQQKIIIVELMIFERIYEFSSTTFWYKLISNFINKSLIWMQFFLVKTETIFKSWFFRIVFGGGKKAIFAIFLTFSAIFRYLQENVWFFSTLIQNWY